MLSYSLSLSRSRTFSLSLSFFLSLSLSLAHSLSLSLSFPPSLPRTHLVSQLPSRVEQAPTIVCMYTHVCVCVALQFPKQFEQASANFIFSTYLCIRNAVCLYTYFDLFRFLVLTFFVYTYFDLMWCKSDCIVMCACVSIWSYAMKIGFVDNHHFRNGTIQTGKTVLGADTKCLNESLHTCYSKWLEDHIQTLLDNLPLGMKMHRWCSCVCVTHACAML